MAETVQAKNHFTAYANSVKFELQSLDLRMMFGQIRQSGDTEEQGVVILAWPEAKLLSYFLALNLAIFETVSERKIAIPPEMLPSPPPALVPDKEDDPFANKIHAATMKLYDDFIASL